MTRRPTRARQARHNGTTSRISRALLVATAVLITASSAVGASHAGATTTTSLTLVSQTPWLSAPGTFSITVHVDSSLPATSLGLRATVYSALPTRHVFAVSTTNSEAVSEQCVDQTAVLPLPGLSGSANGNVSYSFAVTPLGPSGCESATSAFSIDADGVYPLQVELVSEANGAVVTSFTTHIEVARTRTGSLPLHVALAIPLGSGPGLRPDGSPAVASELSQIAAQVGALSSTRPRLSVSIPPSVLQGLEKTGSPATARLLAQIDALVSHGLPNARVELLTTPYADIDASALTAAGLGGDVATNFTRGRTLLTRHFGGHPALGPYVSPALVDANGLASLESACNEEMVIPEASVPVLAQEQLTPTAPFFLSRESACPTASSPPEAFAADSELAQEIVAPGDPVLDGENVLADLAQIYYDAPFAPMTRAVVVAPDGPVDARTLAVLMEGLHNSPILASSQLSTLFTTVPVPDGSSGSVAAATLTTTIGKGAPSSTSVAAARAAAGEVAATTPNNHAHIRSLDDDVLLAEGRLLTTRQRAPYLSAPASALSTIGREIAVVGSGRVTLTSTSGHIPIILRSTVPGPGPVVVVVHVSSNDLVVRGQASQTIPLTAKDKDMTVDVGVRTSGIATLDVTVMSGAGKVVLGRSRIDVRSTAVSVVAIGLTAAAALVLLAWWIRSILSARRRRSSVAPEHA